MKTKVFFSLMFLIVSMFVYVPHTAAQDYTKWGLPEGAKARLGKGNINEIAYSPDGTTLAVAGSAGIWLYDADTGEELSLLTGHTSGVYSVSFSPDGKTLASGSEDNAIRLWDVDTGNHRTLTGHGGRIYSVSFSPDGQTLASGGWNHTIRLWDVDTGNHRTLTGHTSWVLSVAFSPDGTTLASGSGDDTIRLWDVDTGDPIRTLLGHLSSVVSVSFSPDGQTLASGSGDSTVRLWDVDTGNHRTLTGHTGEVDRVSFSPDGEVLSSGGSEDNTIRLWDVSTGDPIRTLTLTGHTEQVKSVAFSPDGTMLASGSWHDPTRLWDVSTGDLLRTLTGHTGPVLSVSSDGKTIASRSGYRTIHLWNAETGDPIRTLTGHTDDIFSVSFSPDGQTLASGSRDKTIRLWDVSTGDPIRTLIHTWDVSEVLNVSFSPDGQTLASGGRKAIHLWDVATGDPIHTLTGHTERVTSLSFSPDGQTLASASDDNTIRLWEVTTGDPIRTLTRAGYSVSFSPDGQTLASASWREVRLWDVATVTHKATLTGHTDYVLSVAFSPDNTTLASGSGDGTVLLWTLTPEMLEPLTPDPDSDGTLETATPLALDNTAHSEEIDPGDDVDYFSVQVDEAGELTAYTTGDLDTIGTLQNSEGTTLATNDDDDENVDTLNFRIAHDVVPGTYYVKVESYESETGDYTVYAEFSAAPSADVNGDGVINIQDLVLVASRFGETGENAADVNGDGEVNIQDLVLVAGAFGDVAAAPTAHNLSILTPETVQQWLSEASQMKLTDAGSRRGIVVLEHLLATLTPKETVLLANYPNPFNPETWIPYRLSTPADVTLTIYAADGQVVRTLAVGHQPAGIYQSRSRAAYWDGRNAQGEPVASGVYFYTLTAGEFTATRKMLIRN